MATALKSPGNKADGWQKPVSRKRQALPFLWLTGTERCYKPYYLFVVYPEVDMARDSGILVIVERTSSAASHRGRTKTDMRFT